MTPESIKEKIQQTIPDADVVVEDLAGDQKHFGVDVVSAEFEGKSTIIGRAASDDLSILRR